MAEAGRVTITLGRSGQVVKRAGATSNVDFSDSHPVAGSKRSVRDRLGGNIDSSLLRGSQLNNKRMVMMMFFHSCYMELANLIPYFRQRGDGHTTSLNANGLNDVHIGKDDLRFKLMQKNVFRRAQSDDNQKGMDLREKLSRMGQPPVNSYETHQRMPDSRERMPESREASMLARIPSTRSADDLPLVTTPRSSYSPWTLDHLRQRSPDRVMGASRGLSPPRNVEELQRRPVNRTYDDVRTVPYMGKDVLDAPRPVRTGSFVTKPTLATTSAKPMPPGPPIPSLVPPPRGIVQKSSYSGDEQQTVEGLLHSLGLGKYAILFKAEEKKGIHEMQWRSNQLRTKMCLHFYMWI
ncbi:uncharacterized protein LOC111282808 isoform X2 [Durio zibethinus]|uniref:Uncharacterized protein LOC111282808 isoform X2 n=1 Tax=Durio zibethinus TaxID=66656 RepID=A0A6P5XGF3_DURZI|nr:uncharacterized protein LOC111282808 isoform X2 [Durio zibethinus]